MTIYLDNNATTQVDPRVVEAMAECYRRWPGNPASQHAPGRAARRVLEEAREEIAALLGANAAGRHPDKLIFTSGATEANNLAMRGIVGTVGPTFLSANNNTAPPHLILSAIEHPSVSALADQLATEGVAIARLPVDHHGVIILDELAPLLTPQTRLVCVMLGSNETGALQPVAEAAAICRAANVPLHSNAGVPLHCNVGVPLHCDAVQVAGKLPINFAALGAATMSISAHKFHGPRGVGALVVRGGTQLTPQLYGGFQQEALRPGSEPVALAVGMATALRLWHSEAAARAARMTAQRDQFESQLLSGDPTIVIHAQGAARLPHTSHMAFPGLDRQALLMALDLAGVACSAGSSCASGSSELSPTLLAMGISHPLATASLRFSLSAQSMPEEVREAARRILKVCNNLRSLQEHRKSPLAAPLEASKPV